MSSNQEEYKKHLLEIMTRLKSGEATEAELREIDQWYEGSASDEKYADGMSNSEKLQAKAKMLQRINSRIYQEAVPLRKINTHQNLRKMALAAVLLVIASGSIFFYQQNRQSKSDQQILANKIAPGGNKAILTLANGQKINLNDALNGQLATQSGMRITKTANGQLVYEVAKDGSSETTPQYNTIEVPVGGQWQAILADGSRVWLNALSSITFPTAFTGKERRVEIKGEAYFEIAHNKAMPFRVSSLGQTVEVLGTHFNVMAYADEKVIKTTLLEGSVKISDGGRTQLLKPGEQAQVSANNIKVTNDVDIEDVVAWKNGYFKFADNLESTMNKIARWYDVEVVYEDKPDNSLSFGGEVSRTRNIRDVLNIMEYTGKIHFKIEGRRILVKK
ncbi:FecR family protein [Pedobacter nyackensis]|uniref:FecR family protein n=1 Tax=Pedobacter nyackensis TaxID=475255 RepID=A0A1W2A2U0_9SPHI|nr:FecR family protein [Pedobacter nyackensis]SMC54761.1 FecR family protein [Pedobacter nyackensis]